MIVLDTNVVSELMSTRPAPAVQAWVRACDPAELYTTAITYAEVRYGIERLPGGRRRDRIRSAAEEVFSAFADRVLAFDAAAAVEYALVVTCRERTGAPIDGFDAQIAALCRRHAADLATRNGRGFRDLGISVIDPWR